MSARETCTFYFFTHTSEITNTNVGTYLLYLIYHLFSLWSRTFQIYFLTLSLLTFLILNYIPGMGAILKSIANSLYPPLA